MEELQMTWQLNLLNEKRWIGPPIGLKNLGNSCYLNSVIQCLTYTPPLANFCLKRLHSSSCDSAADCPFCILEERTARSLSADDLAVDTPVKLHSCLRIFADHFRPGRQEDAHEFLRYVIDSCHVTCLSGGYSVVKEIFGGSLQSQVKCLSCGFESNKVDEIMDISLDVSHTSSLSESIEKFFEAEVLDGTNKYKCDKCKQLVEARKQMSLLQAPNVLVIQLKRFEGIFGGKIDRAISFEERLVLSSYMSKEIHDPYPEYSLFGAIVHSGYSRHSGHYYAYIKNATGRWYCCNDAHVKISDPKEVLSEKSEDANSRKKLEEFKEGIMIEASSALRSCGWTEEVLQSMRAKKICLLQEAGDVARESNELKKMLILDAKRSFLPQIPKLCKDKITLSIRTFKDKNITIM